MRIQNNIMAMNTHRFYTANNNAVAKSAEKLSSGYRVNRAGDDAAGLAISEKMRAEIRGLSMASKNSQDGVSMVQTAEGALTEVQAMLQRMKELAVQAASDSNADEIDRPALDQEFQQLIKEIDDVAMTTTFNDMKLLDGSFTDKVIQIGSRTNNEMEISIGNMDAESLGLKGVTDAPTVEGGDALTVAPTNGDAGASTKGKLVVDLADVSVDGPGTVKLTLGDYSAEVELTEADVESGETIAAAFAGVKLKDADGNEVDLVGAVNGTQVTFEQATADDLTLDAIDSATLEGVAPTAEAGLTQAVTLEQAAAEDDTLTFSSEAAGLTAVFNHDGTSWVLDEDASTIPAGYEVAFSSTDTAGELTITATEGGNVPENPFADLAITAYGGALTEATTLGEATWEEGVGVNLLNQDNASAAIDLCYAALNKVSTQRAELGAIQNRLEHKISNLDNTVENVSAAEARIRDVDIAKEMTNFTKNQILSQAATAMLAQANSLPQNVLSLLQ